MGKLTASSLATPIFHRRRRDWRDDQYLIEQCVKSVSSKNNADKNEHGNIEELIKINNKIKEEG